MPVGQDEKAAVIDDQLEAVILMAEVPTDPAIPCSALQGRGGKAQKGYPLTAPPIDCARWRRTRVSRQSWAKNPGNDALASGSGNAALRTDEWAGQESPRGSRQLPSKKM